MYTNTEYPKVNRPEIGARGMDPEIGYRDAVVSKSAGLLDHLDRTEKELEILHMAIADLGQKLSPILKSIAEESRVDDGKLMPNTSNVGSTVIHIKDKIIDLRNRVNAITTAVDF